MTIAVREKLRALDRSVKTNSAVVEKQLAQSGSKPSKAVVFSAAKYYDALKKLAAK